MPQIARLIGGAGTGKTTELLRIMEKAIAAGVSPEQIGFVSFTRAARSEAAGRAAAQFGASRSDLETHGWFRTLHSVCFRCLEAGRGQMLTGDRDSGKWLQGVFEQEVSAVVEDDDQEFGERFNEEQTPVEKALGLWSLSRNCLAPFEAAWKNSSDSALPDLEECRRFVERYELHKRLDGRMDFTDLVGAFAGVRFGFDGCEEAKPIGETPAVPVWFFDENQDTSPLLHRAELRLIENPACQWVYVAGDPFQSIYCFAGADHQCFMRWEAAKQRIMPQSFRCPKPILELGEEVLRECSDYFDRGIAPADHEGAVEFEWWSDAVLGQVDPRESWLLIARTNYLANRFVGSLNASAIPWIPTRGNGGWKHGKKSEAMAALIALQDGHPIEPAEWRRIVEAIPAKCDGAELLTRGTKKLWAEKEYKPESPLCGRGAIGEWGGTQTLIDLIASGGWTELVEHADRFVQAWRQWGPEAVAASKVRVGTIHSVKGQEADNVMIRAASTKKCSDSDPDEERRVAYVGVTRARKKLVIVKERNAKFRMPL